MSPANSPTENREKKSSKPTGFRTVGRMRNVNPGNRKKPDANQPKHNRQAPSSSPATTSRRSAPPLPKRNKGRLFVAAVFLAAFFAAGYLIWFSFFQYQSYGVIQGRVITVSAPWNGIVINWQVNEGDEVQQGQTLAEITNLEMKHQLQSLLDELKLNQAKLDAETSKLNFETQSRLTETERIHAEYLQTAGDLGAEQAKSEDLEKQLSRARKLMKGKNFSEQKYDQLYFDFVGQQRKIEKLSLAVSALKTSYELARRETSTNRRPEIQPLLARIETTESEIDRIREKILQGRITSPVNGRITKKLFLTGESVKLNEPVLEILETDSIEAILYVRQEHSDQFEVDAIIDLELPPYDQPIGCQVLRLGEKMDAPPLHLQRYYQPDSVLLPVHLKPLPEFEHFVSFRINGLLKLPVDVHQNFNDTLTKVIDWFNGIKALGDDFAASGNTPMKSNFAEIVVENSDGS